MAFTGILSFACCENFDICFSFGCCFCTQCGQEFLKVYNKDGKFWVYSNGEKIFLPSFEDK
jgi:hypothetical protein